MASFAFDIYAATAPNGSRLVRLTPSKAVSLAFRLPEIGFGQEDGQIVIHSDHADATAANFAKHNLVKVVAIEDDLTETKVGGFFLEHGDFTALSLGEAGGRKLKFSGPNTFQYLERAILREQAYTTEPIPLPDVRGGVNIDGMWTWGQDADGREPGPIMVRCLEEGRDQPGTPLADATWDFTRSVDSASVAWDALGDEWQVPWGTTIADMAILFIRSGEFFFRWTADLEYSAYKADPSVTRTSSTFAADKVLFKAGENIVTEVHRGTDGSQDASAVLATGQEFATAFVDGGTSSVAWIRHVNAQEATVAARLTKIAQRELDARSIRVDAAFPLTHIVLDDELNGGYIPFVHYAPGDTVTIHTGTGDHDFNNFAINVAAVRIVHDEAGNWFGMPELGAQTIEFGSRSMEERSNRLLQGPNPELCRPAVTNEGVAASCLAAVNLMTEIATPNGDFEDGGTLGTSPTNWSGAVLASGDPSGVGGSFYSTQSGVGSAGWRYTGWQGVKTFVSGTTYVARVWADGTGGREIRFGTTTDLATQTVVMGGEQCIEWTPAVTTDQAYFEDTRASGGELTTDNLQAYEGGDAFNPRDGHADLVGTSIRAKRCDDTEHYHTTADPTVNDDTTLGFRNKTLWFNESGGVVKSWLLLDNADGAADWLLVSTTDHGGLAGLGDDDHPQYIKDSEFGAAGDTLRGTGAGTFETVKNNLAGTAAPTVNEDSGDGYSVGSRWIDTTNDKEYVCLDASVGAAVWIETTQAGGGGSPTVREVDGSPSITASTAIEFPNGTLSEPSAGIARYTPAAGGGGVAQAYVGYSTIGGSRETVTNRRVYMKKVTLANDCLLTNIEAYIDWQGPSAEQGGAMGVAVFADNAGSPRELLSFVPNRLSSIVLDHQSNATADGLGRWFGVPLGRWLAAGDYWIAVQHLVSGLISTRIAYDATGSDRYYTAGGDFFIDSGFYTVTTSSNQYSIRANTIR